MLGYTTDEREALYGEFGALCKLLSKWLEKNMHPHAMAVVTSGHAELWEGSLGIDFIHEAQNEKEGGTQ
jgi:hypothetical protein